jgi:hypothetical protein
LLADARELPQPGLRLSHLAGRIALADVARAVAAQALKREDAVVAINPLDADCVSSNFLQTLDLGMLWLQNSHERALR